MVNHINFGIPLIITLSNLGACSQSMSLQAQPAAIQHVSSTSSNDANTSNGDGSQNDGTSLSDHVTDPGGGSGSGTVEPSNQIIANPQPKLRVFYLGSAVANNSNQVFNFAYAHKNQNSPKLDFVLKNVGDAPLTITLPTQDPAITNVDLNIIPNSGDPIGQSISYADIALPKTVLAPGESTPMSLFVKTEHLLCGKANSTCSALSNPDTAEFKFYFSSNDSTQATFGMAFSALVTP